ncbi:signal transduction histidine kinase [Deinococcus metalli]|uniref:histidine kinase n=1 Tax=Deinococcus metalli TaxID=1141878 RepID=A0A7W8KBL0_9DEIO|nr:GAF domain-containing sensor histidine kinase [Deinococcus metalli]MBB5375189.1 signal transduction histidine kinase [Deinococcus metalli]GHF31090.1 hypothetical protein GCM10017781_04080 [Deinococcus metalli]
MLNPGAGLPEPADLTDAFWTQLQAVTEHLAAAHTQNEVDDAVLLLARQALGAVSGVILIVSGPHLRVARRHGDDPLARTVWVGRPLSAVTPATDAVRLRQPQFYEHLGSLLAVYPHLETQTGGTAAVASAVMPMMLDAEVLGVLALDFHGPHVFSAGEVHFLQTLAAQAALALDRIRLLHHAQTSEQQRDEVERRNQALEAFAVMSRDLAGETDRYVLVRRAQEIMLSLLSPGYALYWERGEDRWQLKSQVGDIGNPELQRLVDEHGLPLDAPALHTTWLTGVPNYQDNYAQGADTPAEMIRHVNAATAFQVRLYGRPIGMLAIGLFDQRTWTPMDKVLLETSITSLGLALDRAEQTRHLQERTAGLDAFVAFTEAVGSELDVHSLAQQAIRVIEAHLGAVSVAYYERHRDLWIGVDWSKNVRPEVAAQMQGGVPLDAPNFADAVRRRTPVFLDTWNAGDNHLSTAGMYGAAAFCPIFIDGEAQAILAVGQFGGVTWTDRTRAIVRAVGRSLGLALERAAQARALTAQRDALDRRTQELEAANGELEAFAYSASHDLRTPIRHVMGFSELARVALARNDTDKVERNLGIVQQGARRMDELVDGMLMLSRAGRQEFRPRWVALDPLISQAQQDAHLEFPAQDIHVQWPRSVQVWGDPTLIQQVMTNLVSNAVKYSTMRPRSEVTVLVQDSETEWTITVSDNGVGFDPQYAGKLFGIFQRLHPQSAFPGVGAGLATVRRIVIKHGGRVFARSVEGQGATFGFTLAKPAP